MEENIELKQGDKRKKVIIGSILLVLLGIVGFLVIKSNTNVLQTLEQEVIIELGEEFSYDIDTYIDLSTLEDAVKTNVLENALLEISDYETITIISNEEEKEVPVIGQYSVTITYEKEVVEITMIVEDTTSPVFEEIDEKFLSLERLQDETFDESLLENYGATDLSEVTVTYDDSEVDYTTVGEYTLQVIATDESGNETMLEVAISIIEPKIEVDKEEIILAVEEFYTLTPTYTGTISGTYTFSYESQDETIATVNVNGKITGVSSGETIVIVSLNGIEKEISITVEKTSSSSSNSSSNNSSSNSFNSSNSSGSSGSSSSSSSSSNSSGSSSSSSNSSSSSSNSSNSSSSTSSVQGPYISVEALSYINAERTKLGLSALVSNSYLEAAVKIRAEELLTSFNSSHTRPSGEIWASVLDDVNYPNVEWVTYRTYAVGAGECLAGYYSSAYSVIYDGWKNSSGHWNTLMTEDVKYGSVAYIIDSNGDYYWCAIVIEY